MNQTAPTSSAPQLVKAFAEIATTEELILFIAGTDNMLTFCQELLEQYDQEVQGPLVQEINAHCTARAVLPGALFAEVRKVLLALNRFHDANRNHYAVLGLAEDADRDQVKKAYRSLSKQYHPDKQPDTAQGAQRFMEIAGAYHAIMTGPANRKTDRPATSWRTHRTSKSGGRSDHKRFFLGLLIIICLLIGTSIFLSGQYNRHVLSRQMNGYQKQSLPNEGSHESTPPPLPEEPAFAPALRPPVVQAAFETDSDVSGEMDRANMVKSIALAPGIGPAPTKGDIRSPAISPDPLTPLSEPPIPDFPDEPVAKKAPAPPGTPSVPAIEVAAVPDPPSPIANHPLPAEQKIAPRRISAINTSLEISSLVNHYSSLYNSRDLEGFLALFSNEATENGNSVATLTDQYRSLFAHTSEIDLSVANLEWKKERDGFLAHGSFQVSYTYRDNKKRDYTGSIRFDLVRQQDALKIRTLEYEFH